MSDSRGKDWMVDIKDGDMDLYPPARQKDLGGKDVQQVTVIKDKDGNRVC